MGIYYCDIGGEEAYEDTPVYKLCGCGKHVCSYHWDYRNGMCVNCAGTSTHSRSYSYGASYHTANSSYPSYNYSAPKSYSYSTSYESGYSGSYIDDLPIGKLLLGGLIVLSIIAFIFIYALMQIGNFIAGLFL